MASIIRRWSSAELPIAGGQIHVADDGIDILIDRHAAMTPIDRLLAAFLRTRCGKPLAGDVIQALPLAHKKIALEAVVTEQSRVLGIDVLERGRFRPFLTEIRGALTEEGLDDLAQRFNQRWQETNHLAYVGLRASASATVL